MSASQDKKRRQAERAAGTSPKTMAQREAEQKLKKEHRTWTIVGVIVALFVVLIIVLNTNLLYTGTTAMTIGDHEFTNAQYQYYYNTALNNFVYNYQSILSLFGLDTSQDLDDQNVNIGTLEAFGVTVPDALATDDSDEDAEPVTVTWAEYFKQTALQNMVQVTAIYDAAVEAGYTLSEEDSKAIDDTMDNFATLAEQNNLRGADGYIAVVYGKGVNSGTVRELLERAYIAEDYSQDVYDGFEYTAEQLNSYYDENADSFDALTFDYYLVAAEKEEVTTTNDDGEEETNEEVTEATMADAKETADAIAEAVKGGADFAETVADEIADAEITSNENVFGYYVSSNLGAISEWLLSADRAEGDVGVIERENSGYYVVVFHSRTDNTDYNGVNFRHILVKATDEDDDDEISDEELQAAEDKINDIYEQWTSGEATEDSFAELANTESDDTVSNTNGGLYEHVAKNQMVDPINDWIFDSSRQSGDTDIIYVEASNYTGYHLVYFVGTDSFTYHDCLAQYGLSSGPEGLRAQDYAAWEKDAVSGYSVSINSFINWFAKV